MVSTSWVVWVQAQQAPSLPALCQCCLPQRSRCEVWLDIQWSEPHGITTTRVAWLHSTAVRRTAADESRALRGVCLGSIFAFADMGAHAVRVGVKV
jgi:hypothetical protein